jgi:hypothetical protein
MALENKLEQISLLLVTGQSSSGLCNPTGATSYA